MSYINISNHTISGTTVFNFGFEDNRVVTTILNNKITLDRIKSINIIPIGTIETSLDDFTLNGVDFNLEGIIDNTSFNLVATSLNNASGNYTIKYMITI